MSSKLNQYLVILMAFALVLANSVVSLADDEQAEAEISFSSGFEETSNTEEVESATTDVSQSTTTTAPETKDPENANEGAEFLSRLKQELNLSKGDYQQVLNSMNDTQKRLETVTEEQTTLRQQLYNLEQLLRETTKKYLKVTSEIIEKENTIALIYEEIEIREVALETQKNLLNDYIKIIYQDEDAYLSFDKNGDLDALKLLLSGGSVGENLRQLDYLDLLNETGQQLVDNLDQTSKELEGKRVELERERLKLDELRAGIGEEKEQIEIQKSSKEQLIKITQGQEEIYRQLLEQTLEQQEQLVSDVKSLSDAVTFIEIKIEEEGPNFDPEKYRSLFSEKNKALYDFHLETLGSSASGFIWPVQPDRGISAYFHDPRYAGSFGVQHQAVDIPEYQGSTVRAANDGVVYTAKDNGYGYSYVIIAHAGNLQSVYGHLSSILIKEGQVVSKGTIIGLSGGMPGTKGAGYMTTGPHLHFEVHLNGLYVDPLNYLPLPVLTEDQMTNLPEKYQLRWREAILEGAKEPIRRLTGEDE